MKGLQLAEAYYHAYGEVMIRERFPTLEKRAAIGLVGQGSECLGFDDEISKDHDYGPSFCIWLTDEDYAVYGEALAEAYAHLPKEFDGLVRLESPNGGGRVGVHRISDFYRSLIGRPEAPKQSWDWMWIPESRLCTAVNGKVFTDPLGEFSRIRQELSAFYPEDVRKKKLAARAVIMAQSGQYNYARLMKRGETVAATMALSEFIKHTISMVHLLNRKYTPFYKWMHRSLGTCERLCEIGNKLTELVSVQDSLEAWQTDAGDSSPVGFTLHEQDRKVVLIEEICGLVIAECRRQNLTDSKDSYLEPHALEMMKRIEDPQIRNLHVMEG